MFVKEREENSQNNSHKNYPKKSNQSFGNDELKHLKVPPHSLEAEQSVIGGLMLDNQAWDRISDKVYEKDFYRREHRFIFQEIARLGEKNIPFDVVTLSDSLDHSGKLEEVGGLAYLSELARGTPSVANISAYANIVHEKAILRELLAVSTEVADKVYFPDGASVNDILDEAEQKVFAIAEHGQRETGPVSIKDIVPSVIQRLDDLMGKEGGVTGLPTHYKDLDKLTSGLQNADLVIIAGRPSMGKTLLGMNIAENIAMDAEKPALIFSMEMPKDSIIMRQISSLGRIDQSSLRSGRLEDHDWSKIFSTMTLLTDRMNMYIDDTPALSPSELRSRARRLAREHGGLSVIVVDYLQLMHVPGNSEGRTNEVSEISRNLKALAKELNVPVIALSQLSRKVEDRTDKRPMNSDLRESGAIEQDADVIMFIYRDEVYHPESEHKGTAEIIIGKQRNGPIGMVRLTFLGHYCRFDDFSSQRMN